MHCADALGIPVVVYGIPVVGVCIALFVFLPVERLHFEERYSHKKRKSSALNVKSAID